MVPHGSHAGDPRPFTLDLARHLFSVEMIAREVERRCIGGGIVAAYHGAHWQGTVSATPDGGAEMVIASLPGYPRGMRLQFFSFSQLYRWLFDVMPPDALPPSLRSTPPDAAGIIAAFGTANEEANDSRSPFTRHTRQPRRAAERRARKGGGA